MTDRRLFSTGPLAAARMRMHFGMRLRPAYSSERAVPAGAEVTRSAHPRFGGRFSTHRDSLPVVGPREADVYATDSGCGWPATTPSESWNRQGGHVRVVRRNGIAIMWPESEAA